MHVQARAAPTASPADLAAFLRVLAPNPDTGRDRINIEGGAGTAVELGGKFVFVVTHGRFREAWDRMHEDGYTCEWTEDLYAESVPPDQAQDGTAAEEDPNQPGVLLGVVERAKASDIAGGRNIDTVLIGAFTDEPGRFFIQVTFEGSEWRDDRPKNHA
jgi:hypothetical protein